MEPDEGAARRFVGLLEAGGEGFTVHHVTELSRALEHLSDGGTDVVLLDLDLPDSTGLVTYERMAAFAPNLPVVVLTQGDDEELALAGVEGGAQDVLVKSEASPPVLTRTLRHAVERHRLMSALRSLALLDDLTGLYNRRGFDELGAHYLRLARRSGRSATLLTVDVDRFKTINDTMGHHLGDRALLRLAEILRGAFRGSDLVARLGADEFAVLAPDTSADPPQSLLDRVLGSVREFNAESKDPFHLSISMGAARFDVQDPVALHELLEEARESRRWEKRRKRETPS